MRLRRTATALLLCASMCACESPPECAEGTVADGDVCVPEACGIGTWGDLPVDGDTVYVDGAADPGGDGSEDAPLASIQDGLDLAGSRGGGQVAVAAGSYSEALALDHGHAGVDLAGRCRELVTLDASDVTAHAAIQVAAEAGDEIVLSSLTVTGGAAGADDVTGDTTDAGGLVLTGGTVTAREVDLVANAMFGARVAGADSALTLEDVTARDTHPVEPPGQFLPGDDVYDQPPFHWGNGIFVGDGARLDASAFLIEDNVEVGLLVRGHGTTVSLQDGAIRQTRYGPGAVPGMGLSALGIVDVVVTDVVFERNEGFGVAAWGWDGEGEVLLERVAIRDTGWNHPEAGAPGIYVLSPATVTVRSSVIERSQEHGIRCDLPGSFVVLEDVDIDDTRAPFNEYVSAGITAWDGCGLIATDARIRRTVGLGVVVGGIPGEITQQARLTDVLVQDTRRSSSFTIALGVAAYRERILVADGLRVESTEGPGLHASSAGVVDCEGCSIVGNAFAGAAVHDHGRLFLKQSTIEDTVPDDHAGGGVGVYAGYEHGAHGWVEIDGSEIESHPISAVWFEGPGALFVRDSTLHGGSQSTVLPGIESHGDAVYMEYRPGGDPFDVGTHVELIGNRFVDAGGAGVFLHGMSAYLADNEYSGNEDDLWQQHCDGVPEPTGLEEVPNQVLCPDPERINLLLHLDLFGEMPGLE